MDQIKSALGAILLLFLIATGIFGYLLEFTGEFIKFILWLFQLSLTDFGLSPFVEILVKSFTFILSYALVGLIFNLLGFFNSKIMSFAYFVISTLVWFGISATIMFFQENIIIISWIVISVFSICLISFVAYKLYFGKVKE
jgi:hypothetical protein